MGNNKRSDYDDMSSGGMDSRINEKRFRAMKRIVSVIILIFIAASIAGIVYLLTSSGEPDETSKELMALQLDVIEGLKPEEDASNAVIAGELTEEQKQAAASTEEMFRTPDGSGQESGAVNDTGENSSASDVTSEDTTNNLTDEDSGADHPAVTGDEEDADSTDAVTGTAGEDAAEEVETETESGAAETGEGDPAGEEEGNAGVTLNNQVTYSEYTVVQGDTISRIASLFGLQPETIVGVNQITDVNQITTGSTLVIPDRDGQVYIVKSGDSLSLIAYSFDMGYVTLAEINGLTSSLIRPGDRLFIPNKTISEEEYLKVMKTLFIIPAEGQITVRFGQELEDFITGEMTQSDGIHIKNSSGTEIQASKSGQVIYIGNNPSGLGRHVIISHESGYMTVYGHLDRYYVSEGDYVEQGDRIALMGSTGKILEPTLYFEVRKDSVPVDPEQFFH